MTRHYTHIGEAAALSGMLASLDAGQTDRVVRGANCMNPAYFLRCAFRYASATPSRLDMNSGFRCVRRH
jgi:formylglycine-generating enzyme required for sulfatase activity